MPTWTLFLSAFVATTTAAPTQTPLGFFEKIWKIQKDTSWLDTPQYPPSTCIMVLPIDDIDPRKRVQDITNKQDSLVYGSPHLGNLSYFPSGVLGEAMVRYDLDEWRYDTIPMIRDVLEDVDVATIALDNTSGLKSPLDYRYLYEDQWKNSVPLGIAPGAFTKYSSDLLFAMERLSVNPYIIRRLHPTEDNLPFAVNDGIMRRLTGMSLQALHHQGRLFLADHSYQAKLPLTKGRYSAACSAYFYLHPSGEFLPLAIKTNVGANLVYTPLDEETDCLLAKTMFNVNDLAHGQVFHLVNSPAIYEVVHLEALRTLSDKHPILVLLNRLKYQAYALRPVGESYLFKPPGLWERSFAITPEGAYIFATSLYQNLTGSFKADYFHANLIKRGLLNCTYGPPLKHFPFYKDASILHSSIETFIATFVERYYPNNDILISNHEIQSWIREANGKASVIDFPLSPLTERSELIDILTHIAFLNGVSHYVSPSGTLPLHPSSLYAPIPT